MHPQLAISVNLAWEKLDTYYIKLDDSPAYAAALILHPRFRLQYFEKRWTGNLAKYLSKMKKAVRTLYTEQYEPEPTPSDDNNDEAGGDWLDSYLDNIIPQKIEDEWKFYSEGQPIVMPDRNLFHWWNDQSHLPGVRQMAFDHLSIPAMSAETERIFSDTKITISPLRNRLKDDIIEATECENRWLKVGL